MPSEALTYSASAVDVATMVYFFDAQHIGDFSIRIMKPDVDFRSLVSPPKSALIKVEKSPETLNVIQ